MYFDPYLMEQNFLELGGLVQKVSVMLGIGLVVAAMFQFKRYGEMRTFMSHQMTMAKPLMMMMGGIFFMAIPTIAGLAIKTIWGTENPLAYNDTMGWRNLIPPILVFVRVIGVGSMMRGFMHISRSGAYGAQPGTFGRALIHIIAGIMLLHVIGTYDVIKQLTGIS